MKRALLLAGICLLFNSFASADEFEKKHGIGVIRVPLDSLAGLYLYELPNDEAAFHFILTMQDTAHPSLRHFYFDNLKEDSFPSWFTPLIFYTNIENCRLEINCLEETTLFYKTNLKSESGKNIWVRKEKQIHFLPWLNFYLGMASLEYSGDAALIYEKPMVNSTHFYFTTTPANGRVMIIPIEIQGSWMKVEMFETNENAEKIDKKAGWILWRNDKEPLIKFNLMGC